MGQAYTLALLSASLWLGDGVAGASPGHASIDSPGNGGSECKARVTDGEKPSGTCSDTADCAGARDGTARGLQPQSSTSPKHTLITSARSVDGFE
jgi:hypothetical protein